MKPNLQNIPKVMAVDSVQINLRSLLRAPTSTYVLLSADYSQIEVRILAHVTQDEALIEVFAKGGDVYINLASEIFNRPGVNISPEERNRAKVICLGVIYGMGAPAAAARLNISVPQATQIMNNFFQRFFKVKAWIEATRSYARQQDYIETICGRRRYLSSGGIPASHAARAQIDRQAVNSVIQGSASDVIKLAMILLSRKLQSRQDLLACQILLQIHDEVVLECPHDETSLQLLISTVKEVMEVAVAMDLGIVRVPLTVSISVGLSLGEMEELFH